MALITDTINMKMIVPMTEKVADLLANFKTGVEDVPTKVGGVPTFQSVTDDVRQANYKYTYGDRKTMFERKQKFKEMLTFATQLLSDPILNQAMNHIELAKFGFEQLGVDNTRKGSLMEQDKQAWAIYQLMQDKEQWGLIHQFLMDYLYSKPTATTQWITYWGSRG